MVAERRERDRQRARHPQQRQGDRAEGQRRQRPALDEALARRAIVLGQVVGGLQDPMQRADRRVGAGAGHLDDQRPLGDQRRREHRRARRLERGGRLAGQRALVGRADARDDDPVHRHGAPGAHHHPIVEAHVGERDLDLDAVTLHPRRGRQLAEDVLELGVGAPPGPAEGLHAPVDERRAERRGGEVPGDQGATEADRVDRRDPAPLGVVPHLPGSAEEGHGHDRQRHHAHERQRRPRHHRRGVERQRRAAERQPAVEVRVVRLAHRLRVGHVDRHRERRPPDRRIDRRLFGRGGRVALGPLTGRGGAVEQASRHRDRGADDEQADQHGASERAPRRAPPGAHAPRRRAITPPSAGRGARPFGRRGRGRGAHPAPRGGARPRSSARAPRRAGRACEGRAAPPAASPRDARRPPA